MKDEEVQHEGLELRVYEICGFPKRENPQSLGTLEILRDKLKIMGDLRVGFGVDFVAALKLFGVYALGSTFRFTPVLLKLV